MGDGSIPEGVDYKYDEGKLFGSLPYTDFPNALEAVSKVGTMGAKKYKRHSWRGVENAFERYEDAFYRHLTAHNKGEVNDPESGLPHWFHVVWNSMALLELKL